MLRHSIVQFVLFTVAVSEVVCGNLKPAYGQLQQLRVCFWNVESGGASPLVNAQRIADESEVAVWGLSEVGGSRDADRYQVAANDGESGVFDSILGTTGGADRLQIIYDSTRLEMVETGELHEINVGGSVRAPLWARFRINGTETEFTFMVNHLYRSNEAGRHEQARMLNDWAESQTFPSIVGGDMNFDWHYQHGETNHDQGLDLLIEGDVFRWVRPEDPLVPTNSSSHKSVLDFVFAGGEAREWSASSTILVQAGDFPDGRSRSDHRPVDAIFMVPTGEESAGLAVRSFASALDAVRTRNRHEPLSESDDAEEASVKNVNTPRAGDEQRKRVLLQIDRMTLELKELREQIESSNDE